MFGFARTVGRPGQQELDFGQRIGRARQLGGARRGQELLDQPGGFLRLAAVVRQVSLGMQRHQLAPRAGLREIDRRHDRVNQRAELERIRDSGVLEGNIFGRLDVPSQRAGQSRERILPQRATVGRDRLDRAHRRRGRRRRRANFAHDLVEFCQPDARACGNVLLASRRRFGRHSDARPGFGGRQRTDQLARSASQTARPTATSTDLDLSDVIDTAGKDQVVRGAGGCDVEQTLQLVERSRLLHELPKLVSARRALAAAPRAFAPADPAAGRGAPARRAGCCARSRSGTNTIGNSSPFA